MSSGNWNERFLAGTRGQILTLLRRESRSVDELARSLELTGNAVRTHLTTLERDGLVQQRSERRGVGKPTYVYNLTEQGERLFSKAYEPVLTNLLDTLAESTAPAQLEELLRAAGRRMVSNQVRPSGDLRARLGAAVALLNDELGGLVELEESGGSLSVCGYSCPLAPLVQSHPQMCKLMEAMITEYAGVAVRERCERGVALACHFEVSLTNS